LGLAPQNIMKIPRCKWIFGWRVDLILVK